jgi:hypothetical protein
MPASAEHLAPPGSGAATPHHVSFSPRDDADAARHPLSSRPHSQRSSTSASPAEPRRRTAARAPDSDSSAASPAGASGSKDAEALGKGADTDDGGTGKQRRRGVALPSQVAWVVPVLTSWAKMKPLIRSSIVAWLVSLPKPARTA